MTDHNPPSVLTFEDRLPVGEKKLEKPFSENQITDLNHSAMDVLSAIISLEQMGFEHVESDVKGVSAEIHRIEQKLDFITELLAKVIQAQQTTPQIKAIKMSADHVIWCSDIQFNPGDFCLLSIHLSQKYPTPLELPVRVIGNCSESTLEPMIEGQILLSDEGVIDDLTRMIFLFHRRQIARHRS